jgi:Carboxypeptidase regulatory-like domain
MSRLASVGHSALLFLTPAALFLLVCLPLQAQNSRGTILGHVNDPSGASIAGVRVTARNLGTGVTNAFTTNPAGDYVFVDLI